MGWYPGRVKYRAAYAANKLIWAINLGSPVIFICPRTWSPNSLTNIYEKGGLSQLLGGKKHTLAKLPRPTQSTIRVQGQSHHNLIFDNWGLIIQNCHHHHHHLCPVEVCRKLWYSQSIVISWWWWRQCLENQWPMIKVIKMIIMINYNRDGDDDID